MTGAVRHVSSKAELLEAIDGLVHGGRQPDGAVSHTVILLGGADFTEAELLADLRVFFGALAGYCERTSTAVVDGGTDSGVMRLVADARSSLNGTFPLVGVAPAGALRRTTQTGASIDVAAGHSLVVLVPGSRFGEETEWLFEAADHLGPDPATTIVVNGGKLALEEARLRLAAGHPIVVVQGSGRAADELARDEGLRASGRLRVIPLTAGEAELAAVLE